MTRVKSIGHGLAVLVFVFTGTFGSQARADDGSAKAVAETLFRDAKQLLEAGDLASACPTFAASLTVDRTLGTLLYLAACHEEQGRTATAWSEFAAALPWARQLGEAERVAFAQRHMAKLEPRLSSVVIHPISMAGLEVKMDDSPLSAAAIGSPLPLDPGTHVMRASAPGHIPWQKVIEVPPEAGNIAIDIPALAPIPSPPMARVAPAQVVATHAPSGEAATGHERARHTGALWTAVAVTGVGVAVGSIFGALTFAARDSALKACNGDQCTSSGLDDIDRARTFASISTLGFGVSLASAATAVYFIVVRNRPAASQATASALGGVMVGPTLSRREAGLSFEAAF